MTSPTLDDGLDAALVVKGCRIHFRRFPRQGAPRLVLVHGGGAHAGWWTGVIPDLRGSFDLIVPDLSGHGDSGHRAEYRPELWAEELKAITMADEVSHRSVTVVGHSMGGKVGVYVAARWPRLVERLVLVDTGLRPPGSDERRIDAGLASRRKIVYRSPEEARGRFRLRPPQPCDCPELVELVASQAIARVEGGWTWKFDPNIFEQFIDAALHQELQRLRCPVDFIYGGRSSIAGAQTVEYIEKTLQSSVRAVCIPDAYHHVPLDAPLSCARAVRSLLQPADSTQADGCGAS